MTRRAAHGYGWPDVATEVLTRRWCDVCLSGEGGLRVEAEAATVAVNGFGRELDLCQPCRDRYLAPVIELLTEYGHEPERPHRPRAPKISRREPGDFRCPLCSKDFGNNREALNNHLKNVHELSASARVRHMPPARHGTGGIKVCPECGKEVGG